MLGKGDGKLRDRPTLRYAMLLTQDDGGQRVAGTIKLANGRITGKARCGFRRLIENTVVHRHFIDGGRASVTATSDPLRWIQSLPQNYTGTYLRAQKLEETRPGGASLHRLRRTTGPQESPLNPRRESRPPVWRKSKGRFSPWRRNCIRAKVAMTRRWRNCWKHGGNSRRRQRDLSDPCSHIFMEWTEFESGDEPEVLTADLCAAFTCEKCPGFAKAGDVQPDHPDPETTVFCMHWCHQVAPEV